MQETELPCTLLVRNQEESESIIQSILNKDGLAIESTAKQGRYGFYLLYDIGNVDLKKIMISTLYRNGVSSGYWLSCAYEEDYQYLLHKYTLDTGSALFRCPKRILSQSTNQNEMAIKWRANCLLKAIS